MKRHYKSLIAVILLFIFAADNFAQTGLPLLSPKASIMQNVGITKVEIKYNRPAVRDRKIWGDLVPFNAVWRTGANEATTIEFSTNVKLNGNEVPKGKYSIFTIPGEKEWTVIINKAWDIWGLDYAGHESEDVVRFKVTPESCDNTDRLLFFFSNTSRKSAVLNFAWEKLKFSFTVDSYLTADNDKSVRLSPAASVYQTVGYTDFIISFGSPAVNNRTIWGTLVPFYSVWRAGANEATTIEFSTDVKIAGTKVPAGKYALFAIPAPDGDWTFILNTVWKQWGLDYNKNKGYDLLKFKAKQEKNGFNERLFYKFFDISDNSVTLALLWENLKVSFKIEIDLEEIAYKRITASLDKAKAGDWQIYLSSAAYAIENNFFKDEPVKWIDKSLSIKESFRGYFLKARYYFLNKQFENALKQIDKCRDAGQADPKYQSFISQVDDLERKIRENLK